MVFVERAKIVLEEHNWPVFPVSRNKIPCIKGGRNAATKDHDTILKWGAEFPDANVGVPTGKESGIFVLDIDNQDAEQLLRRLGKLPTTLCATSGRGRHLYFQWIGGRIVNRAGRLVRRSPVHWKPDRWIDLPGLDVRGDGGSIIVPPSVHLSGRPYKWEDPSIGVALPPPWLLRMLGEKRDVSLDRHFAAEYENGLFERIIGELRSTKEGGRNAALNVAAFRIGALVGQGFVSENDAQISLIQAASAIGLPRHESLATIRSGLRAGRSKVATTRPRRSIPTAERMRLRRSGP